MEQKNLANQLYDSEMVSMELFEKVNEILGCDHENCTAEDFVWGAEDTWWDSYDCSVEVIRPKDAEWMSQEQANLILDLGFRRIYESIGDKARIWRETGFSNGTPRNATEVMRLKATIAVLKAELEKFTN
jgi:hypothetical protein